MDLFPSLLAVLVYLFSFLGIIPKADAPARAPSPGGGALSSGAAAMEVAAFYAERRKGDPAPARSLRAAGSKLTSVMVFGPAITAAGRLAGAPDRGILAEARARGLRILAVVHNAGSGRFDAAAVHALLRSPSARERAVSEIQGFLGDYDLDGVCLDLENVPPGDREELTAFVRDLSARLRSRYFLVAACLPAKTGDDPGSAWGGAYDFASLGSFLDQAVIMAYDEHHSGGPPGPVASLGWVERVVRYAASVLPRQKIVLGLPAYGYVWSAGGGGRAITNAGAESILQSRGIAASWDRAAQVPCFRYTQSGTIHSVWYEDERSAAAKAALARRYGLRGVAVWRLGYEDPGLWGALEEELG